MMRQNLLQIAGISLCTFQVAWIVASAGADSTASPLPFSVLRKRGTADCKFMLEEMGPVGPGVVSIVERKPGEHKKSLFVEMPLSGAVVGLYIIYKGPEALQKDVRQQEIVLAQCKDNSPEAAEVCIETFMPLYRPYKKEIEKIIGLFFYRYDEDGSFYPTRKGYSEDLGCRPLVVSKLMNEIINLDLPYGFFKQDISRIHRRSDDHGLFAPESRSGHKKHIEVVLSYPWMSHVSSYWTFYRKRWFLDDRSLNLLNKGCPRK